MLGMLQGFITINIIVIRYIFSQSRVNFIIIICAKIMEQKKVIGQTCKKKVNNYSIFFTFSDIQIDVEAHTDRESFYYKSIILYDELNVIYKQIFENLLQIFTTIKQSANERLSFKEGTLRFIVPMGSKQKQIELISLKQHEYTLLELQAHLKTVVEQKHRQMQAAVDQKDRVIQRILKDINGSGNAIIKGVYAKDYKI